MAARGITERVQTGRHLWTRQRLASGRTIYRKDGKFTSAKAYRAARSYRAADIESTVLSRAADFGTITPNTQWIRGTPEGNRAGPLASQLLAEVETGQFLSDEQLRMLMREIRYVHGFEAFWRQQPELSRAEAEDKFSRMIDKLRSLKTAAEREAARIEFGLEGGSGFDARKAAAA